MKRLIIVAAAWSLSSCLSEQARWMESSRTLGAAVPVISFELGPEFDALKGQDRISRENEMVDTLAQLCAEPIFSPFIKAFLDAEPDLRRNAVVTLTNFISPARSADFALKACFRKQGAVGNVFLSVAGTDLSSEQYVLALLELAQSRPAAPVFVGPFGGCGSRGGPGYRKPNGQCAGWRD